MSGSIQTKNGKLYIVVSYKDENGKSRQKWHATGLTERGNKRKAKEIMQEILSGYEEHPPCKNQIQQSSSTNDILFGDFLEQWLEFKIPTIEKITAITYTRQTKKIKKYFNEKKIYLKTIKPYDVQGFYNLLYSERSSTNTAIKYHAIIRQALDYAYKLELTEKNIATLIQKPKHQKYQASFYNVEEIKKLLEIVKGDPLELLITVCATYGLRRSEVLGIKWSAIDFENKLLRINHKVLWLENRFIKSNKMKNTSSNRTLPLIDTIADMFLKEKQRQADNKIKYGCDYNTEFEDYVFVNDQGKLFTPSFISQHFSIILKNNNLKHIRFHDLRHSCASAMLSMGVSMKQIQEWLGHSTYNMTADTYTHLDFSAKIASADQISKIFSEKDNLTFMPREQVLLNKIAELEDKIKVLSNQ